MPEKPSEISTSIRKISVVVPIYNERQNIHELVKAVTAAMSDTPITYELILVDDGSTDGTTEMLSQLQDDPAKFGIVDGSVKIIILRRNFGQTAAISAGFDHATGDVIVPIDGDLQNDPTDIPRLVAKLQEGYDVVSGWRRNRKDKLLTRKIPSWIANYVIGLITGVKLHDYGCTLKAYHKDVVDNIRLYGEMHRFIPALASWSGAKVAEIEVKHHPRLRGTTKYGLNRTFKVILDLITVKFLGSFSTKPLHIFGGIGMLSLLGSFLSGASVLYQKFISPSHLSMNRNPLLIVSAILMVMSVQFMLMGLLAEMTARTYHESQGKPTYIIRTIIEVTGADESNHNG